MLDDFPALVEDGALIEPSELEADEYNLIYVAMTRTVFNLRFHKESTLPDFVRLVQKHHKKSIA